MSRFKKYTDEQIAEAVKRSISTSGTMRLLGINVTGSQHRHMSRRIKDAGIDTSHFTHEKAPHLHPPRRSPDEVLSVLPSRSHRTSGKQLTRALLAIGVPYECAIDGVKEWNEQPLVLQVDHIDGDGLNNCRENLRFLCANCHTQTSNYAGNKNDKKEPNRCPCGKEINRKSQHCRKHAVQSNGNLSRGRPTKIEWPSICDLEQRLLELKGNRSALARELGVSETAVRKHMGV